MCYYTKLVPNPKYKPNKKNGGIIASVPDIRITRVPVKCGKCMECKKQKARDWRTRLLEEIRSGEKAVFVTLTFSNESIKELENKINYTHIEIPKAPKTGYNLDNQIATTAVALFRERWRKEYGKSIKHWLVTELGHKGTQNIHLHGILWTKEPIEKIKHHWKYGFIWPQNNQVKNYVNSQTINYIVKYVHKMDYDHKTYNQIVLTSPGIGKNYINRLDAKLNKFNENQTIETYTAESGHKISLPIYYRNKIYTDEEREALWLHKLDKQIRYVNGIKIDVSKNEDEFLRAIKQARKKNIELGYGTSHRDNELKKYEEEQRKIMQETRIKNAKEKKPPAEYVSPTGRETD